MRPAQRRVALDERGQPGRSGVERPPKRLRPGRSQRAVHQDACPVRPSGLVRQPRFEHPAVDLDTERDPREVPGHRGQRCASIVDLAEVEVRGRCQHSSLESHGGWKRRHQVQGPARFPCCQQRLGRGERQLVDQPPRVPGVPLRTHRREQQPQRSLGLVGHPEQPGLREQLHEHEPGIGLIPGRVDSTVEMLARRCRLRAFQVNPRRRKVRVARVPRQRHSSTPVRHASRPPADPPGRPPAGHAARGSRTRRAIRSPAARWRTRAGTRVPPDGCHRRTAPTHPRGRPAWSTARRADPARA